MADVAYCMKCRSVSSQDVDAGNDACVARHLPGLRHKLTKIMGMDAAKAMGWKAPWFKRQQLQG
jgi:hypothetical protein